MNHLLTSIVVASLSLTAWTAHAEPVDDGPPAQTQKKAVPDTNESGNYLEEQPNNNGTKEMPNKKDKTSKPNNSKPSNIEKSKKVIEEPNDGGVDVK